MIQKPRKVLVIGSGPIVIGQAAEFDYSGTQCCRALKEEGIEVLLVNSNPATIQTDFEFADRIYIEPLRFETLKKIIEIEKPDGMIATMAGQTGLNLAVELKDVLKDNSVRVLGTSLESIELAENREKFRDLILKIGEPIPKSKRILKNEEAKAALEEIGLPLIIRPDYCLGGTGTAVVHSKENFFAAAEKALLLSGTHSALIEQYLVGLSELEYEVMRDSDDNCITICNMENLDPLGIHTGESIVVAPSQTLTDKEYHMLRESAIKVIRALDVKGACNIQFGLDQKNGKYYIIEVNPRTSRSSALASKATGYPIARVATKIALGYKLHEIENRITGKSAAFEPALDYAVVKIPKWPFDKLHAERTIGTQMKSTGEVMAIGRNFEEALQKAMRSLEIKFRMDIDFSDREAMKKMLRPNELRLFAIIEILKKGAMSVSEIAEETGFHPWFIGKIGNIANAARDANAGKDAGNAKEANAPLKSKPVFKMVDTCAGEFEALTPYYYSSSNDTEDESQLLEKGGKKKIVILGSGPIRIGQGIEFDYCTVHAVLALKEAGYETIIINNNPETVSTDFDIANKLYFEPLTPEYVMNVIEREKDVDGVLVQFGGQTAINLTHALHSNGVKILGTSPDSIDASQDRKRFKALMQKLKIPIVESAVAFSREEAMETAKNISFPLLLRPSYVLGGRAMDIVYSESELMEKVDEALFASGKHAVIMDCLLQDAIEVDVDVLSDGENAKIAGIMEQIEEAGVHSGDSSCVIPSVRISENALVKIRSHTKKICSSLKIIGLANIQMALKGDEVYVLEVNSRASRTIPYLSKATGHPLAKIAALLQVGRKLTEFFSEFEKELLPPEGLFAVKVPVFPFQKFPDVDPVLSPEMKSTGEVMGIGKTFEEAYLKALLSAGSSFGKSVYVGSCGKWRKAIMNALRGTDFEIYDGEKAEVKDAHESLLKNGKISFVIDGIPGANGNGNSGHSVRSLAIQLKIPCITSAFAAMRIISSIKKISGDGKAQAFQPLALNRPKN